MDGHARAAVVLPQQLMKIGLVTTWADCGAGQVSLAYAKGLSANGCHVEIYSRGSYLRQQRWGACESRPWPLQLDRSVAGLTLVNSRQFGRWLQRFRPDWLIFNEQRSWAPVLQARDAGVRCAAYVDYYKADTVELFQLYDLLVCHTQRHYGVFCHDPRALFIPWGVDMGRFRPGARLTSQAADDAQLVLVHSAGMGGPSDRKGTDLALHAFTGVNGSARLLFHTQLPREQWPASWRHAIALDPRIEVLEGPIDPVALYQQGDLYLYPSRLEGIGLTLPEALATGLAAITTDAPPMSEFVEAGSTGSLVPVQDFRGRSDGYYWPESWVDPEQLRACIQRYVDQPMLARSQGKQARVDMERSRSWMALVPLLVRALDATTPRVLPFHQFRHLQDLARYQDRMLEPTTADHLQQACRSLARGLRRRVQHWGHR
jgi:1,2-diacylglycerol 3-alpha-glucosyltransferase